MKARHAEANRAAALAVFAAANCTPDQNFFTLSASQVDVFLVEADRVRYQKPKNANGSRGRYFYARMQRHARA